MPTVLVTTPTGHVGSRIVGRLLDADATVRVLARDPERLAAEVRDRVHVVTGSLDDPAAVARAMDGVGAAFLLIPPPDPQITAWRAWQRQLGDIMARAAAAAGVGHVVFLSSLGAHRDDLGPVSGLGLVERTLAAALPNVAALRPGYFFENTLNALPTIAADGAIYGNFPPDLAFAQVATRDVGDVAARWLLDAGWAGHHTAAVHGPRDLSMDELAALSSEALGRPVRYVQVPIEGVRAGLEAAGLGPDMVREYTRMLGGLAAARFEHPEPRTAHTTTATEYAEWAADALRPAFEAFDGAAALRA